jgi:hypothetical protein
MKKRENHKKPLLRIFWPKPDAGDSNPNVSFRTRNTEKMRLRRKIKADQELYPKYLDRRREGIAGRTLLIQTLQREILKSEALDLDYLAFK